MSVKMMGAVWDCALPRNEKYVLLAMADHADHEGRNIYPSVERIAWKTGYDDRMVQRLIKNLVKKGVLVKYGTGQNRTNKYRIELKCLPERPEYTPSEKLEGGKMSPSNAQNVTHEGGKMSPKPSSNHPSTVMGASAESNFEKLFPREEVPVVVDNRPPLAERIKSKDPALMMAALGVTAKEQASEGIKAIEQAHWNIGDQRIKRVCAAFIEITDYPIPAKPERGKWLKLAKEQLEEFTEDEIPTLYRKAWEEYLPQVLAGELDITHPGALTNKMRAIKLRTVEQKPQFKFTLVQTGEPA